MSRNVCIFCQVQNEKLRMTPRRKYVLLVFLSIEPNSIRLGGPCHGIVIKIVHKTLPRSLFVCLKLDLVQLYLVIFLPYSKEKEVVLLPPLHCVYNKNRFKCLRCFVAHCFWNVGCEKCRARVGFLWEYWQGCLKRDLHNNSKIVISCVFIDSFLELSIKMCKLFTAFQVSFTNVQCYMTELYIVWKLKC